MTADAPTSASPSRSRPQHPRKLEGRDGASKSFTSRPSWPWIKRVVSILFFGLVAYLIFTNARELEWAQVGQSLHKLPFVFLAPAAMVGVLSYAVYSCYDLIGRQYAGHRLSTGQVVATTVVSYAFNLSLGTWVGGIGFRHRLYSRLGLSTGEISRVVIFSMLTNWSGYLLLAGTVFLLRPLDIPDDWVLGAGALQALGAVLVSLAIGYALLCQLSSRREWTLRGHVIELPSGRMAVLQLLLSTLNWLLMAGMVYLLLQAKVAYLTVIAVLLIAAIAGVIAHIPAGLGVLESVFVALLSAQVARYDLLAALFAYRALYYLGPLAVATALYLFMEARIAGKITDSQSG